MTAADRQKNALGSVTLLYSDWCSDRNDTGPIQALRAGESEILHEAAFRRRTNENRARDSSASGRPPLSK